MLKQAGSIPAVGTGVSFNAPPDRMLGDVMGQIQAAVNALPPGTNGAFMTIADLSGINASVVARGPLGFKVQAWIGKKWTGPLEAGVTVVRTW